MLTRAALPVHNVPVRSAAPRFGFLVGSLLLLAAGWAGVGAAQNAGSPTVLVADLADVIHPISSEYLVETIDEAAAARVDLLVLRLDTPGGLDTSMREIIQAMLASPVPICLFVGPSGARAASAGFFMAMAAECVVMAPGTNMGAASPVSVGGGEVDPTVQSKLLQDAEAYIRSLAERHGRPAALAAEAVATGRSWAASEAVETGLADFLADDVDDLLVQVSGRSFSGAEPLPELAGAEIITRTPSLRQRVLAVIANPQVAYMLMLLGIAGLYFELSTPGAVLPGVLGGVSLVLALLAFQVLPISFAGLALVGLGILFLILEIKVTSYGLLAVAGLGSFVLGSLMLFPGPIPQLRLSPAFVIPTALAVAGIAGTLVWMVVGSHRHKVTTGPAGLVGKRGVAQGDIGPGNPGKVFVHGELWRARADVAVRAGEAVEVIGLEAGMFVHVRPSTHKGS